METPGLDAVGHSIRGWRGANTRNFVGANYMSSENRRSIFPPSGSECEQKRALPRLTVGVGRNPNIVECSHRIDCTVPIRGDRPCDHPSHAAMPWSWPPVLPQSLG